MSNESEEHFDWKGRKAYSKRHGGFKAAVLVCGVEVLENMVFLSNGINFVSYFEKGMHYQGEKAANMVTNFIGTSFLLTMFGGFISDSFLGKFRTFILFCSLELLGLILLLIQAEHPQLQPKGIETPSSTQEALLYIGLYTMAAGVGGVKSTLPAHDADQVDHYNLSQVTTFFNGFFFSLCTGGFVAATFMVWIQENKGWKSSFKISALALSLALLLFAMGFPWYKFKRPDGSPFTRIFKVLISATRYRRLSAPTTSQFAEEDDSVSRPRHKFKFLDKATADETIESNQVEEARTFLGLLPIFACTIFMNCCLAQLQTFSVQQGYFMNRKLLHHFTIPTPSLTIFPVIIMLSSIPLYEGLGRVMEKSSSSNNHHMLFRPLLRIGLGLALATVSMALAAVVEAKRREAAHHQVKLSVLWLVWQYVLLGISDMLTLRGMLEFFYKEAPSSMRSICTSLSWCSTSMGYFLSSVLVVLANALSTRFGGGARWLIGSDLNASRLDLFYTLLCAINFLNFLNYLYWAKRY